MLYLQKTRTPRTKVLVIVIVLLSIFNSATREILLKQNYTRKKNFKIALGVFVSSLIAIMLSEIIIAVYQCIKRCCCKAKVGCTDRLIETVSTALEFSALFMYFFGDNFFSVTQFGEFSDDDKDSIKISTQAILGIAIFLYSLSVVAPETSEADATVGEQQPLVADTEPSETNHFSKPKCCKKIQAIENILPMIFLIPKTDILHNIVIEDFEEEPDSCADGVKVVSLLFAILIVLVGSFAIIYYSKIIYTEDKEKNKRRAIATALIVGGLLFFALAAHTIADNNSPLQCFGKTKEANRIVRIVFLFFEFFLLGLAISLYLCLKQVQDENTNVPEVIEHT